MTNRRTTKVYPPLYLLSTVLFSAALCGILALVGSDVIHRYRQSLEHARLASLSLIMIGLSYIALNMSRDHSLADRVKGIFLGSAFLMWGGELLVRSPRVATVLDEGAVIIFVVDLSAIIWGHLRRAQSVEAD